ncbi:MAG: addiction module protein [Pseudomonadota bacterium]
MASKFEQIQSDIASLTREERLELLRSLMSELDGPSVPGAEERWAEEAQRRLKEIEEGRVKPVPGELVFERIRKQLG